MNIREIAKLAGVSISTVSKIINEKDENISQETRARVMQIVKENNYVPYAGVRPPKNARSFLIGVLLSARCGHERMFSGISDRAKESGYGVVVYTADNAGEEDGGIANLCGRQVDGVLWDRASDSEGSPGERLEKQRIPCYIVDCRRTATAEVGGLDYIRFGYNAAQALVARKHQRIGCLVPDDSSRTRRFFKGFEQCLFDNKVPFESGMFRVWQENEPDSSILLHSFTGLVCFNAHLAGHIYEQAASCNVRIPRDLSVVALVGDPDEVYLFPKLAAIQLPLYELGRYACSRLIAKIENIRIPEVAFRCDGKVQGQASIDVPVTLRNKKIVVVGTINMDTLITLNRIPRMGETVTTPKRALIPGGKGLNQAIGAARLGAEVYLIGKLGKDYEGGSLYDCLKANNVNTEGVGTEREVSTGHAYVYVQENGESGIVVYAGANDMLSPRDIENNAHLLENASFCLLHTEIPMQTVEYAARAAREKGVKVLLKPCAVREIGDELMRNVDIFLPNRNELGMLYPGDAPLEAKAQHFLDRGAKMVIVTLDSDGCYLRDAERSMYFSAADFEPVDTTGAADAFAATLTVYLSRHYDIVSAVKYATYAAGFSITRQGVPPSLVDKTTMDLYFPD